MSKPEYNAHCVSIIFEGDEAEPWISVFSSQEKCHAFYEKARKIINEKHIAAHVVLGVDACVIDSESYLDCLESQEDGYDEEYELDDDFPYYDAG